MEFDNVHLHVRIYHFYHLNQIIFSDIVTHIARCIHLDVEYIERVIIIRNAMCVYVTASPSWRRWCCRRDRWSSRCRVRPPSDRDSPAHNNNLHFNRRKGHAVKYCVVRTSMEQPMSDIRLCARSMRLSRSSGVFSRISKRSTTPPVKSVSASDVSPPLSAS